jgi:hypothetical protein
MRILLPGRIAGRDLISSACATGVLYVAMEAVFSLVFSAMVISNEKKYGPIGIIFALLSYLIAIGVVVILGAVVGLVWQERSSGKTSARHLPLLKETPEGEQTRVLVDSDITISGRLAQFGRAGKSPGQKAPAMTLVWPGWPCRQAWPMCL